MTVYDPSSEANQTRGTIDSRFVEGIDLIPTFLDALGEPPVPHRLEGRSLLPLLHGKRVSWRDAAFSEHDYGFMKARLELELGPSQARSYMVRTERWKYVFFEGFRAQLFDLVNDPREQRDLGTDPAYDAVRSEMHERLFQWMRRRAIRTTMSDETVSQRTNTARERGIIIEIW